MFGTDEHHNISMSICDNDEEYDHRLKKHMRQLEGEHKIQKAVLEQKIELLEMKLREFEEREAGLKKMNSEILVTLGDINKKEDSALMSKMFEELALANKEKVREKKHQQTKFQALKSQFELTISELKGKLAQSEREKKEMESQYKEKVTKYEEELEQERKTYEALRKDLEVRKGNGKGNDEVQRLKKRIAVLEEENNGLKKEFEKETGRMKFQFERNLADLKEIHGEERASFEARLKKTKEMLVKAEEESETKGAAESELMQEVANLREKIIEMEINSIGEIDRIMNEKDAALEKVKELEKSLEDMKKTYEKEQKDACNISSAELFAQNLEERLRHLEQREHKETMSFKTPNTKAESKNTLCEQASVDHLPAFTNFESHLPSLASSMMPEQFMMEKKKAISNQPSQIVGPEFSRCWTHEDLMKIVSSKPHTRSNSRHDLNYISQPQTPKCYHNEPEQHKRSIIKSVCAHSEKPENLVVQENKAYMEKSSVPETQCSCQISGHQLREWALKDTSYARTNCGDPNHMRRQSRVSEEDCGVSYRNDSHLGTEPWNYEKAVQKRAERVQNSFRGVVNYSDKVYMKNEGPMLRRNGSHGMVENSVRRDMSSEKFEDYNNMSVMNIEEGHVYDPNRKPFRDGIHEVMTGLRNIKTRLEKQQEDIIIAKNVSINSEINKRARSISNVKVRPNMMPREALNTSSYYMEGNYRVNDQSRGYLNRVDMNRSAYITDENSVNMHNLSQYGDSKRYAAESLQASYRSRTPVLMKESNRTPFLSRHRNSLV